MLFKSKFTFVFKSGKTVSFRCDNITITKSGNELTGYEIKGCDDKMFYVCLSEIAAIIRG